jgi:hypothetical protein
MRLFVCALCIFIGSGLRSFAQQSATPTAGSAPIQSGDATAQAGTPAGTDAYTSSNKDLHLPDSDNSVVHDTMKNMGAGQSAEDALTNAAKSAAEHAR